MPRTLIACFFFIYCIPAFIRADGTCDSTQDGCSLDTTHTDPDEETKKEDLEETNPPQLPANQKVCVVIRTYWGHGRSTQQGLDQLLQSFARQKHQRWEAVVIVMDTKPFEDLYSIIDKYGDKVWVYAELVGAEYTSKNADGSWNHVYHAMLYNLTDQGIRACPRDTDWLLVTNGDNDYSAQLFAMLQKAGDVDLVSFDYYSRYQRSTGPQCYRFGDSAGTAPCKRNRQRWCHTDLGANMFAYKKFLAEDRRFGTFSDGNHTADHFDGLMIMSLVQSGWRLHYWESHCLYDHSPSPQRCARLNGVWDDTVAATFQGAGGKCITAKQALNKLEAQSDVELVNVRLSNDGDLSDFGVSDHPKEVLCIRTKDTESGHQSMQLFYGPLCMDESDALTFDWDLWEVYQARVSEYNAQVEAQQAAAAAAAAAESQPEGEASQEGVPEPAPPGWMVLPDPPPKDVPNPNPKFRKKYTGPPLDADAPVAKPHTEL